MSGQRGDGGILPGFERLECLWQSVESIKSWLDTFSEFLPLELAGLPFHFWSQMILCTTVLKYLSVLEDPAWSLQAVRNRVNMLSTIDWMVEKLNMAAMEPRLGCGDNLLLLLSKLLARCKIWALNWMDLDNTAGGSGHSAEQNTTSSHSNGLLDLDQLGWIQTMDLDDPEWFNNQLLAEYVH